MLIRVFFTVNGPKNYSKINNFNTTVVTNLKIY